MENLSAFVTFVIESAGPTAVGTIDQNFERFWFTCVKLP
jgi:hypothetical protein